MRAEYFASIITAIVAIFGERKFRRTLEHFNGHCNYLLYYGILKHPEISIFRNTAATNIRKYQTYVIQICTVGQ
jgi:hypothetical protein